MLEEVGKRIWSVPDQYLILRKVGPIPLALAAAVEECDCCPLPGALVEAADSKVFESDSCPDDGDSVLAPW